MKLIIMTPLPRFRYYLQLDMLSMLSNHNEKIRFQISSQVQYQLHVPSCLSVPTKLISKCNHGTEGKGQVTSLGKSFSFCYLEHVTIPGHKEHQEQWQAADTSQGIPLKIQWRCINGWGLLKI